MKIGEKATISDFNIEEIPMKLLEMGCLPGSSVELLQIAPLGCPFYIDINGSHVAIRKELAKNIVVIPE